MATTFQITNGDVTISKVTGSPVLIGNEIGQSDVVQAKLKRSQDLKGSLTLNGVASGASANLSDLIGAVPRLGSEVVGVLIKDQITNMFASILVQQAIRPESRPDNETFSGITNLQVLELSDLVSFNFKLSVSTVDNQKSTISGIFNS